MGVEVVEVVEGIEGVFLMSLVPTT